MSDGSQNASKNLEPLNTATEPTSLTTTEMNTPTSPGLPTVTAAKPPVSLGESSEGSADAASSTNEPGPPESTGEESSATVGAVPPTDSADSTSDADTVSSEGGYVSTKEDPAPAQDSAAARLSTSPSLKRASVPPPVSTDHPPATSPMALDSLLSPTETEAKFSVRESVASSDVTDDETRFSTVLLSARQSLATNPSPKVSHAPSDHLVCVEEGTGSDENTLVEDWRKHKKTASNSTILSASNVPYIASRLSVGSGSRSRPNSLGDKIREEFYQKQVDVDKDNVSEGDAVDWDFWGLVINDYQGFAAEHPERLARAIERGIPKTLRGMVWQLMSASKDPELENTYLLLLKETSPHEKAIMRDLGRTFPHHAFFTDGHGIGQENLFNVLKAYSLYDPQVGYCQGLPFIVAILLLNMPDEEAFCLLVRLMHSYDLRGHFLPEMPKLQLRLFERLLEELLPVLHLHFVRQGIKASMYCSQWFLTMFSYRFPMDIVFRIYDNCLANGIEAMFAFSMALLIKNEETLLSMKFDQLLSFLNTRIFDVYQVEPAQEGQEVKYRVDEFVQDATSLRITPFMLDSYAHEYEELVRARDAHKIEVDTLKNANRQLAAQVKSLEENLAQLNTEHCQVLNELVMARLRHEELESELVRYKLLYAEAMHQSEDAMSSHRISLVASKRGSSSTNG
ncbi:RabGAP/TBC [Trametes sanguinea]|nr:RabGAP/TBC [Trametes sanguinea]